MKLELGTKVKLKTKYGSVDELNCSNVYKQLKAIKQPYGYISRVSPEGNGLTDFRAYYLITEIPDSQSGDFYLEEDVEPYLSLKTERKLKLEKISHV